jgi:solute:Na+ symporter, SSS family
VLKIPMQFFILLLGVLVFVFYQFERPPVFFNQAAWKYAIEHDPGQRLHSLDQQFSAAEAEKEQLIRRWLDAKHAGDRRAEAQARAQAQTVLERSDRLRDEAAKALVANDPGAKANDADYVFITFVLAHLPHGLIGLLIAVFFAAALSSESAELNALGATTTVDFYRHLRSNHASDAHDVAASKWFTLLWGLVALAFALFANLVENLIQAINIVGSVFYGVVLGIFLVAFFLKRVRGTAVFWSALAAQALVFILYFSLTIGYLWYNFIGCAACVLFSLVIQFALGSTAKRRPVTNDK